MRDRLTTDKTKIFARESITIMSMTKDELRRHYNEIFDRLQEYEVAEEQGQIFAPPCKVGDTVYVKYYGEIVNAYVTEIEVNSKGLIVKVYIDPDTDREYDAEDVFLTKEEAEQASRKEDEGK